MALATWRTSYRTRSPRLSLAVELVVLACAAPLLLFSNSSGIRGVVVGCLVLAIPYVTARAARIPSARRTPFDVPLLILSSMAVLAAGIAIDFSSALSRLLGLVFGFAVYFATVRIGLLSRGSTNVLVWLLLLQGVAIALIGLVATSWEVQKATSLAPIFTRIPRLITQVQSSTGTVGGVHPAELAGVLTLLWPLGLGFLLWPETSRPLRGVSILVAGLLGLVTVLSFSRSAYAGLVVAGAVLAVVRLPRRVALIGAGVLVLVMLLGTEAVSAMSPSLPVADLLDAFGRGLEDRARLWYSGLQFVRDFPLAGIGLNAYPHLVDANPSLLERAPHAHNLFLQTALDFGLPGLMAFLWILGIAMRCWRRAWRDNREVHMKPALAGLLAGVAGYLVYSLTDTVALGAKPSYLLWMTLGTIVAASMQPSLDISHA